MQERRDGSGQQQWKEELQTKSLYIRGKPGSAYTVALKTSDSIPSEQAHDEGEIQSKAVVFGLVEASMLTEANKNGCADGLECANFKISSSEVLTLRSPINDGLDISVDL
ncbi:hypothetical protein PoB_004029400 [Plakobranchus ocellatus]|uniref:Uncharacterized protein n=1 Tax=Plakobranchus ocellatus TaxID=259542 RepID=A0AAV4B1A1_9GAST|nr:hypothetical protein PoB_004029400 [Plakobranchus ocellatus]